MKKLLLLTFILMCSTVNVEAKKFGPGERLVYLVHWGVIPAGYATLEVRSKTVKAGRNVYHLWSEAKSNSFFDSIYKVRDVNESWYDYENNVSVGYEKTLREGKYAKDEKVLYDLEKGLAYKSGRKEPIVIPSKVLDILSSLYYIRKLENISPKMHPKLDVQSGEKVWKLEVRIYGKEKVKLPIGEFNCWKMEPIMRDDGIFKAKGRLFVWLKDDESLLPVRLRTEIAVGFMDIDLKEYK
ncbi:MAG: DUF3108 domain-containing protein [Elusimicrobiota bacterium]